MISKHPIFFGCFRIKDYVTINHGFKLQTRQFIRSLVYIHLSNDNFSFLKARLSIYAWVCLLILQKQYTALLKTKTTDSNSYSYYNYWSLNIANFQIFKIKFQKECQIEQLSDVRRVLLFWWFLNNCIVFARSAFLKQRFRPR